MNVQKKYLMDYNMRNLLPSMKTEE